MGSTVSCLPVPEAGGGLAFVQPSALARAIPIEGRHVPEKQLCLSCLVLEPCFIFIFTFVGWFVSDYKGNILKISGKHRKFMNCPNHSTFPGPQTTPAVLQESGPIFSLGLDKMGFIGIRNGIRFQFLKTPSQKRKNSKLDRRAN